MANGDGAAIDAAVHKAKITQFTSPERRGRREGRKAATKTDGPCHSLPLSPSHIIPPSLRAGEEVCRNLFKPRGPLRQWTAVDVPVKGHLGAQLTSHLADRPTG